MMLVIRLGFERIVVTLLFVSLAFFGFGQKIKIETASAISRIESSMSKDEAKKKVLLQARINAITQAFGEVIFQGNSSYIRNINSGSEVKTDIVFNQIADIYVNGEWLEDVEVPRYTYQVKNNEDWIEVVVKCKVRELPKNKVEFEVKTLSCPEIKCKTDVFNDGQDFFVLFKSPVDGYLTIYLEVPEEQMSYRILPYDSQKAIPSVKVNGDEEYIFFNDKINKLESKSLVDKLILSLSDTNYSEQNALVIIFSPSEIKDKPLLQNNSVKDNSQMPKTPMSISIKDFEEWILKSKRRDENISSVKTFISINPK